MEDDPSLHRLEGVFETEGGLVIKKKVKTEPEDGTPKMTSRGSQLGLDKLAEEKREERAKKEKEEKERRHYRSHEQDTPGSGISDSVRKSIVK